MSKYVGYTIGVVSRKLGISPQTIRLYERHGLVHPRRTENNIRIFSDRDVERLRTIHHLIHELGVNLAGVEVILQLKEKLVELQNERDYLMNMLFDAGEMIKSILDRMPEETHLIKSSIGCLIRFSDI